MTDRSATQSPDSPILLLGASGKTGRRIQARLSAADRPVRAASRTSEVRFDWTDRSTWDAALDGVSTTYIALPLTPVPIREFVDHAVSVGIRRFVALSGRGANTWEPGFGEDMLALEQAVQASGVQWSIVRASNFAQNFSEDAFWEPIMAGALGLPVGGVPEPFVDVDDVADVAVALLTRSDHVDEIVEVTGPESLTWDEAIRLISKAIECDVTFIDMPSAEFVSEQANAGISKEDAEGLSAMFAEMRRGLLTEPTDGVRQVLGREPRTFAAYAVAAAAAGAWSAPQAS
ncbi:NAD(P)H-binding protein [Nocardioidaceae bacterium SCSIO 66511]|nr:NAD(P)H-binding protein [Nocardioidaceae bacterium SCSIO 66511]